MLTDLLILNNLHYIIIVLSGLAFFAAGWLYLDAWKLDPEKNFNWVKTVGFFVLAVSTWMHVLNAQQEYIVWLNIAKIIGLLILLISYSLDPLQPQPDSENKQNAFLPINATILGQALFPLSTALYLALAITIWRRQGEGLEKQLRWLAVAFSIFTLAETTGIIGNGNFAQNIIWSQFIATYGPLWFIEHTLQLLGLAALIAWVWQYIRFRTEPQIQLVTISVALSTLTISTVVFSYFIFSQFKQTTLDHLRTDVNLVQYSLESLQRENQAQTQQVAEKPEIRQALENSEKEDLSELLLQAAINYNQNTLIAFNNRGEIVARIDEYETPLTSLQQILVRNGLEGKVISTLSKKTTPLHPLIEMYSVAPVYSSSDIDEKIGVLLSGKSVDSPFVDSLKEITGMEITLYANDQRAATTLDQGEASAQILGTKTTNPEVTKTVLEDGEAYRGNDVILGQAYYTVYAPIKSYQDNTIGMILAARPHSKLEKAAQNEITNSMIINSLLIIASIIPASLLARTINKHLKA